MMFVSSMIILMLVLCFSSVVMNSDSWICLFLALK